jgi:hypothetical protein
VTTKYFCVFYCIYAPLTGFFNQNPWDGCTYSSLNAFFEKKVKGNIPKELTRPPMGDRSTPPRRGSSGTPNRAMRFCL